MSRVRPSPTVVPYPLNEDSTDILQVAPTTASFSVLLPDAVKLPGRELQVVRTNAANAFTVTVSGEIAGQTVGGSSSQTLSSLGDTLEVFSDGANWLAKVSRVPIGGSISAKQTVGVLVKKAPGTLPTVMAVPPTLTLGAANAASAIASSQLVPPWDPYFTYDGTVPTFQTGNLDAYIGSTSTVTNSVYPSGNTTSPPWAVEFDFDTTDGKFEVAMYGGTGKCRVLVNGQFASALATFAPANDNNKYLGLVDLGAAGKYRIRVEMTNTFQFRGIQTLLTNGIQAAPRRPQRWIVVGDSFVEPTVNIGTDASTFNADGFVQKLGYLLGVDAWSAGKGSTGYLAVGANVKYRDRLAADIIPNAPDVVVFCGGFNDYSGNTAAAIGAEAAACFAAIKAALPNATIIVTSPWWPRGFTTFANNILATDDAIAAAAVAAGAIYLDLLRLPAPPNGANGGPLPAPTTLAATPANGAGSIQTNAKYTVGTHIQIGQGPTAEVRLVTSNSGTGPFTLTFSGTYNGVSGGGSLLLNGHAAGDPVIPVGHSYLTGTGTGTGGATGDGNSDRFTGSDAAHPTAAGHVHLARMIHRLLALNVT